jgi:flagellar biosynthesis/type III secretory pathway protein FliH
MEAQDNMQLGLQKALSAHEQAASALNDLIGVLSKERYQTMIARIDQNIEELKADVAKSTPGDHV